MISILNKNLSLDVKKAIANANWLLLGRIIAMALGLITTVLIARKLGIEDFGKMNYLLAWAGLMIPFTEMGLQGILTKQFHNDPESERYILGAGLLIRAAGSLLGATILIYIYYMTSLEENIFIFVLLVFSQTFSAAKAATSWFESRVEIAPVTIASLIVLLTASITKIFLVVNDFGWQDLILVYTVEFAIAGVTPLILYFFYSKASLPLIDFRRAIKLLKSGLWLVLASVAVFIYVKIDQIMLGNMKGKADVGIYVAAIKLSEVWQFLPAAIVSSFFPWLLKGRKINIETYYIRLQKLSSYLFILALTIAVSLSVIAFPLVEFIYGENYTSSGTILIVHVWCLIFVFNLTLANRWLLIEEHYRLTALFHGIGALVNIFANLILIPVLGGIGASLATLIALAFPGYILLYLWKDTRPMWRVINRSYILKSVFHKN